MRSKYRFEGYCYAFHTMPRRCRDLLKRCPVIKKREYKIPLEIQFDCLIRRLLIPLPPPSQRKKEISFLSIQIFGQEAPLQITVSVYKSVSPFQLLSSNKRYHSSESFSCIYSILVHATSGIVLLYCSGQAVDQQQQNVDKN